MPTTKTRINVSLSSDIKSMLAKMAHRDRIPQATKAARLIEVALELEEDQAWNAIAKQRDNKHARYRSHHKAWK